MASSVQELLLAAQARNKTPFTSFLEGAAQGVGTAMGNDSAIENAKALLQMEHARVQMEQQAQDRARMEEYQRTLRAELARKTNEAALSGMRSTGAPAPGTNPAQKLATEADYSMDASGKISKTVKSKAIDVAPNDGTKILVTPEMAKKYEGLVAGSFIPSTFLADFGQKKEQAAVKTEATNAKANAAQDTAIGQADLMISKVDQALAKTSGWSTGVGGAIMKNIPASQSKNLSADLDTIKANLGFSTLAEMRRQSPTGGALGAISEREMQLLTSARASLDQAQSKEQVIQHLNEIKTHYANWKDAVLKARDAGVGDSVPATAPKSAPKKNADPLGIL